MEKKNVKIDSWEPSEEPSFKYPSRRKTLDSKKIEENLKPKLIKALEEGIKDGSNS